MHAHPQLTQAGAMCLGIGLLGILVTAGCVSRPPNLERDVRPSSAGQGTAPTMPTAQISDESTSKELRLAQEQGIAAEQALAWLRHRASLPGGELAAGEYRVAYTLSAPRGAYVLEQGQLRWRPPAGNAHLGIHVRDGADGRIVPGLTVRATVLNSDGKPLFTRVMPYGWDPVLDRYADNLQLPGKGTYQVRVEIDPPRYRRHDPVNGDRFSEPAMAEFTPQSIDPAKLPAIMSAAKGDGLSLARAQGRAYARTLDEMTNHVANDGAAKQVGDYVIGYAIEYAEGWWIPHGDKLRYRTGVAASAETNAHIEIVVLDALTGRFMPGLKVHVTLADQDGQVLDSKPEPYMWHPWLYHYGENWRVPRAGKYQLHVQVSPPDYARYGRDIGQRFARPATVDFKDVLFQTGQK